MNHMSFQKIIPCHMLRRKRESWKKKLKEKNRDGRIHCPKAHSFSARLLFSQFSAVWCEPVFTYTQVRTSALFLKLVSKKYSTTENKYSKFQPQTRSYDRLRESREEDKLVFLQPQGETKFLTNSYRLISMAKGSVAKNGCGLAKLHLEVSCAHGLTALIQSTVRLTCPGPELHCSFHTQVH